MQALPGVAPNFVDKQPNSLVKQLSASVSDPADPIPANVLANPIIGEARRFDGAVVPSRWMLAQGQPIAIGDNRPLFSELGTIAGGDGKTSFKLPNPKRRLIIAVAGMLPTTPAMLLRTGRHMTRQDSLGPGARPAPVERASPRVLATRATRDAAVRADQTLAAKTPRYRSGPVVPVPADLRARIEADRDRSREAALAALSAQNRARVEDLVEGILDRRVSHADATRLMASSLSAAEASALLGVFDATQRAFRPAWPGMDHPDPQQEAARYLMAIAFDRDQLYRLRTMSQAE